MTFNDWISLIFAVILVLCIGVVAYGQYQVAHNKKQSDFMISLEKAAGAFVHSVNGMDADGRTKMNTVIASVEQFMEERGHKLTATEKSLVEGLAQEAYDKWGTDIKKAENSNSATNTVPQEQAPAPIGTEEDYNEDDIQDGVKPTESSSESGTTLASSNNSVPTSTTPSTPTQTTREG